MMNGHADIVGQSLCPEVYLAREIGACYAGLYFTVNYGEGIKEKWSHQDMADIFYDDAQSLKEWQKMGVLATEMEAAALYMNAARAGKNALAICTISDNPFTGEVTTPEERQNTFTTMMKIALEVAIA